MSVCPSCPLCVHLAPKPIVVLGGQLRWKNSSQMWLKMSQKKTMILNNFTTLDEIRRVHIFTLRLHKLLLWYDGVGTELGPLCPVLCLLHY